MRCKNGAFWSESDTKLFQAANRLFPVNQDRQNGLFKRKRKVFCQNRDTASQADRLPADEKLFVKKCSLSAILAGNCN
jgi:hypothetical protein